MMRGLSITGSPRVHPPDEPQSDTGPMTEEERAHMRADVGRSLSRVQKELSPKYFYDGRGSELFSRITELPEYYLTRAERRLIETFATGWLGGIGACTLVELGPGSGDKTRRLLGALPSGAVYVPVEISPSYLEQIANELGPDFPDLRILPVRADFTRELPLPEGIGRPLVIAFLGSTIGNFDPSSAGALLRAARSALRTGDRLLLGVDMRKDRETLEAAYNDAEGVTAEFNRNILHVLNRELGADFDPPAFRHRAVYDEVTGRIEMHLVSKRAQRVEIPGVGAFDFEPGESIRTEISSKYDRETIERMLNDAGMVLERWETDEGRYVLAVAAPR